MICTPLSTIIPSGPLIVSSDMTNLVSLICNDSPTDSNPGPPTLSSDIASMVPIIVTPLLDRVSGDGITSISYTPIPHISHTQQLNILPTSLVGSSDTFSDFSAIYDNVFHDALLPIVPEGVHFGDNLHCATINSRGSGEHFTKIEVIVDFAVDELLDFVFVTELKTTRARVSSATFCTRGYFSWWCA